MTSSSKFLTGTPKAVYHIHSPGKPTCLYLSCHFLSTRLNRSHTRSSGRGHCSELWEGHPTQSVSPPPFSPCSVSVSPLPLHLHISLPPAATPSSCGAVRSKAANCFPKFLFPKPSQIDQTVILPCFGLS